MNNKNNFDFWVPLQISKAKSGGKAKKMILGGIASTMDKDADGEFLDPTGFEIEDFKNVGVVNWHHQSKNSPTTIIGEPCKVELRPEGFYVESELYPSSQTARDVWELAETLEKDSTSRRLGYSIEGQVIERASDDENDPLYNVIKKAKITGLAITHMPKNPKTFAEIIKGFSSGAIGSETSSENAEVGEESEDDGLNTKTGKALIKESVNKKLKVLQKSYKIADLDENSTIDKIFETFTDINIQKAKSIFTIIETMKGKKITTNQIEKAMGELGLSMDESNPFLIKGETEEEVEENTTTETSAQRKIRERGLSHEDIMSKVAEASEKEVEEEEDELEDEMDEKDEIKKGGSAKALAKIFTSKLEKAQRDNFQQNRAIAVLIKAQGETIQKAQEENSSLKDIIAQQNRLLKGVVEKFGSTPQPRKSITKSFTEKESFQKGMTNDTTIGDNVLSMSRDYTKVLNLLDTATFAKGGMDAELSKATTSFEAKKVIPQNIIARIKAENGITIID